MDEKPKSKRMTVEEKEILNLYRQSKKNYQEFLDKFHLERSEELKKSIIKNITGNCPFREYCKSGVKI